MACNLAFRNPQSHESGTLCPASTQMYSHAKLPASARSAPATATGAEPPPASEQRDRHEAAADDGAAPEQARERAAADRADGELVVPRRARRQEVLERDEAEVDHHRGRERHRQHGGRLARRRRADDEEQRGGAFGDRLREQIERGVRPLPEIAREALREEEPGVARREDRDHDRPARRARVRTLGKPNHPAASHSAEIGAVRGEEVGAPHHPRSPVRPHEDVVEALGPLEVDDEEHGGRGDEDERDRRPGQARRPRSDRRATRGSRSAASRPSRSPWSADTAPCRGPTASRAACRSRRAHRPGRDGSGDGDPSGRSST